MKFKRAILVRPGKFEIDEVDVKPEKGQILVKVASCGLCNWELNHWKGIISGCPQPLGHEAAGIIAEIGEDVEGFSVGEKATGLLHELTGFSEYTIIEQSKCVKLHESIDPVYAFAEPLKCVLTVARAAAPETGDFGVILGCGPMGLWCIQAMAGSASLIAIDVDERKLELARKYGAKFIINPNKEDAEKSIYEISSGHMADFVIEGTGIPKLLNTAMNYLRNGRGRLVLMSSHESDCANFDFRPAIGKGLEMRVAHLQYSSNELDDLRRTASLLNNGTFKLKETISHVFRLDQMDKAFQTLENKPSDYLKGIVIP